MATFAPNRRSFLAASAGMISASAVLSREQNTDFRMLSQPVLTNPAPDGVTVLWATNGPATGWVEYGESEQLGQRASGSDQGLMPFDERAFKIRLQNLRPGTRYFYRVHVQRMEYGWDFGFRPIPNGAVKSEVMSFTTPNPTASETRFTVWNDTHENVETLRLLHQAHAKTPGDFLLWNGDLTNDIFSEDKMIGQFLSPANLPFATQVPYYMVRGNHDVRGPEARRLPRFTDVPNGRYYYSFRHGPLATIVLDTGEDKPEDSPVYGGLNDFAAFRSFQAEWLAKEIEQPHFKSAPFKILFCHIPLWWTNERSTGTYCLDGRKKWHDLLVKGGIQLVISGHTHAATWLPADKGRPYGQLIGGGPKPDRATYLRGQATKDGLEVVQYALTGAELHRVRIG